jgi:hypothetical protein
MRRVRVSWAERGVTWLSALVLACGSTASLRSQTVERRFLVTERAVDTERGTIGLCVALDRIDRQTVWWWQPGGSGSSCATRSTGGSLAPSPYPGVLEYPATVSQSNDGAVVVSVLFSMIAGGFRELRLEVEPNRIRVVGTDNWIPLLPRVDLNLPLEARR